MATFLEKLENKVQIHHLHVQRFHMVKRLWKSVQYVWRYSTKCAILWPCRYLTFTNKLCQLWSYWIKFHEIFTQYRGIIYAVNAHTEVAISQSISKLPTELYQSAGGIVILPQIGCHGNVPWDNGKRGPDRSSAPKTISFGKKIAKIGPADPEIICLWEIIKKY